MTYDLCLIEFFMIHQFGYVFENLLILFNAAVLRYHLLLLLSLIIIIIIFIVIFQA